MRAVLSPTSDGAHRVTRPTLTGFGSWQLKASLVLGCWCLVLLAVPAMRAQIVADGATNTLSNVTTNITGDVTVGTNGAFTLLILSDNALLTNSANGVIGRNVTAMSNEVQLLSANARWQMGGSLFVGSNGSSSRLVVSNGALLGNSSGTVGLLPGSTSNMALVFGAGSLWNNRLDLRLGGSGLAGGIGNRLEIRGGGQVMNSNAYVATAGNTVLVEGAGSQWSNRADLVFGDIGPGNLLVVSNGGWVVNSNGFVGFSIFSPSNTVVVDGTGSTWSNRADLRLGGVGSWNSLVVTSGGWVVDNSGYVGESSAFNAALVTGANSTWSNRADLFVGSGARGNQLVVSNGGTVVAGRNGVIGNSSFATSNLVFVTGAGSLFAAATNLDVGSNGSFNRLVISNGAQVTHGRFGAVGNSAISMNNEVMVSGPGSAWRYGISLHVGLSGSGNRLTIADGGLVTGSNGGLGGNAEGSNNLVTITGPGSTWSNLTDYYVGSQAPGNQLVVSDGGALFANSDSWIGLNVNSPSNTATVTGPGSLWSYGPRLRVGFTGSGNSLIVSNGAVVGGVDGSIGENAASSNNIAIVTGPNSAWTNLFNFRVGSSGTGNRLVVENGGLIVNDAAFIGALGGGNEALLTGAGSRWNTAAELIVGDQSSANQLVVSNGAAVLNMEGTVGNFTISSNNAAMVTGSGSVWSNANHLYIGRFGSRNRLVITNAGKVFAGGTVFLGESTVTGSNRIVVAGGTLEVTNTSGTGTLDIRRGTNVLNAGLIEVDQLVMTNTQGFFEFNGGTLITRGAFITNIVPFVVGEVPGTPAVWDVRAGPSNHVLGVPLTLGNFSSLNQLLVTNGALLTSLGGFVGLNANAQSNRVVVAGPGSTWSNNGQFEIGSSGPFNSLAVSNGGFMGSGNAYLGVIGSSNLALVTGSGSVWTNATLDVGLGGVENQLVVSDGGTVKSGSGSCGFNFASSNNLIVVTGAGSVWDNANFLSVGTDGAGNRLVVTNGGFVRSSSAQIGAGLSASNNLVAVSGPGSAWSNTSVILGRRGSANRLLVGDGGVVQSADTFIGFEDSLSSDNFALVTDLGSALLNSNSLLVGSSGPRNRLVVSNGATASDNFGTVGFLASASNNLALVTGSSSSWNNAIELNVGYVGRGNQLVVSNGATVTTGVGIIGRDTNANRNAVIVTDPGSQLNNTDLYVGSNGPLSLLVISNRALLSNSNTYLGFSLTSRSNFMWLTGAGTTCSNRGTLDVGELGDGNRFLVSDGARADSKFATIGFLAFASNNEAVVSGPGSIWGVENRLFVGHIGSGNRLIVTNGASLRTDDCQIGAVAQSSNNEAVVTGPGTIWTNSSDLYIGGVGSGNRLSISSGALVLEFNNTIVGFDAASRSNRFVVDGGTFVATNTSDRGLNIRHGTTTLNAGLIDVGRLTLTNGQGFLEFNGGTLSANNSRVSNGTLFRVGNGVSPATFLLAGNGLHEFTGILAAQVRSNATFTGNGTIIGLAPLQFLRGSQLVPGESIGKMVFSNSPSLQGTVIMEISKNGTRLTNDQIQVTAPLAYGGSLVVSNLGPDALAAGDRFQLFSADSYAGGFTNIILPALTSGLEWTNRLLVDGSIEVVVPLQPGFANITLSGTNVIVTGTNGVPGTNYAVLTATNVALPLSNWVSIATNLFGPSGEFSFTNAISDSERERYFRIRTP